MERIDYRKVYREAYGSTSAPRLIDVPPMRYLVFDGEGGPDSPRFQSGIEALFALAYALRALIKQGPMALEFSVMPLEALWWSEKGDAFDPAGGDWRWRLLIMQPPVVDESLVETAKAGLRRKKHRSDFEAVAFEPLEEDKAVQILHVGPYDQEGPAIERMHAFAAAEGWTPAGRHHEIYLTDPRRSPPERWRTLLRRPVVRPG